MHHWSNQALAPSRLEKRSDRALEYVMDQLDIPPCGLEIVKDGIENGRMAMNLTSDVGVAGMWEFHPVMNMSFNKHGRDYTQTTVLQEGLSARGKYIPVTCGDTTVHAVYWPKCGNISTMVKKRENENSTTIIERFHEREFTEIPIPSTLVLLLVGMSVIKWVIK